MEGRIVATLLVTMLSLTGVRCQFVFGYNVRLSTFDCTGHADGVAEIGCDGFVECKSHAIVKHICNDTEVFSRDSMTCTRFVSAVG
ncbi:hypothetical protein BaRGS_00002656 [Batillaria attramentaria]|uniref:Chitin-binding type-2 domain-containing protein n=1 Tax=Batillaria attramentaria TaxID=370345 RepID=A0ABD0M2A0_9CAEN